MTDPHADSSQSSTAEWERLSTLFEAAQSLPPESREQYLDAVCAANPKLRAELEALLASAGDAPAFLQDLAANVVAPVFDRVVSAEAELETGDIVAPIPRTGTRIRHYDVGQRIGGGGMGVVYRARDTRLDRDVALKFLSHARFADDAARRQLVREAQAVSALDDPNVCSMYAIEDTDDGGICLVMAYCAGGTLRDRLRGSLLSIDAAVRITTQVASGLACAHRSGIVHRDLKPANIGFADRDVAKILDFGVAARTIGHATTGVPTLAGTLPYMAPEVLRGESPDTRADVWALGVMLYELLTGRRPFVGPTDASVLYAILEQQPAPLERFDGAAIPAPIAQLITDLLQKAPSSRPADGSAVLARLEELQQFERDIASTSRDDEGNSPGNSAINSASNAVGNATRNLAPTRTRAWTPGAISMAVAALAVVTTISLWSYSHRSRVATVAATSLEVARTTAPLPTIAVLPFAIQGESTLNYLREGMVDLLTPAFDATGLVRGVDPNAVIGADIRPANARAGNARLDSTLAHEWGARVGASRYVVGSVVRTGSTLTLRATLYAASGEERGRSQVVIPNASDISLGVDGLVRQLVSTELRAPGDTLSALAASTTRSSGALRAYLDGERELRDARPAAAVAYFQQAVASDSMFALAWYRLARAAKWSEVDSLNRAALERAFALAPTLPPRLQSIVRAYHAVRLGSPRNAERVLRQLVADYPNDVEAWMLLGELLYETNPYAGRSSDEATSVFRTVMRLDPRNREVTVYLMELAARADRAGELDTLFTMYFSPNSAGEQPGIRRTYLALHARRIVNPGSQQTTRAASAQRADAQRADAKRAEAQRANAQLDDPATALIALRRVGADARDLVAAKAFARSASSPSAPAAARLEGLLSLASLFVAEGQIDSAMVAWRLAQQRDSGSVLVAQTLAALAPDSPVPQDSLPALHQRLLRYVASYPSEGMPLGNAALSLADQTAVLHYLVGVLSIRMNDQGTVASSARQLAKGAGRSTLASTLAQALRGHQALAQRQFAEASTALAAGMVDVPARVRMLVPALQQQVDRVALAEALRGLGRNEEAAAWRASLRDGPAVWSAPYLGRSRN